MIPAVRRAAALVIVFAIWLLGAAGAWAEPVSVIRPNGPSSNRVDLVILGDGYTAAELASGKYAADVESLVQRFFTQQPYAEYNRYFNVHRIDVTSAESGADHPARGILRNTALGAAYDCSGITRLICVNTSLVDGAVARSIADVNARDIILVLVNDPEYGGSGGAVAVASLDPNVVELALHEIGHSFAQLADEYGGPPPPSCFLSEPSAANATMTTARSSIKWAPWIDPSTPVPTPGFTTALPGLYQGAAYCDSGMYRPTFNSKMRSLGVPFEQINVEQHVRRIYNRVRPIDASSPASPLSMSQDDSRLFSVTPMSPQTHALTVTWTLDGTPVAAGPQFVLVAENLAVGAHTVTATVTDGTSFVRSDPTFLLRDSRSWSVTVTLGTGMRMGLGAPAPGVVSQPVSVNGWALNRGATTGTGVDTVHVWAAPTGGGAAIFLGVATYGDARSDIAAIYGNQFLNSGFNLIAGTLLAPGGYTVTAYAHNTLTGLFDAARSANITIEPPASFGLLFIDTPAPASTVTSAFEVGGWAADTGALVGSGVDGIQFYVFPNDGAAPGVYVGTGSYGLSRPDVGAVLGSRFTNSGFHFTITGLGPGAYMLGAYAHSTVTGGFTIVKTLHFTVNANALMSIDVPSAEATLSVPVFGVAGWAIDRAVESTSLPGTGVDTVHVYAYRNPGSGDPAIFLGIASMNIARPDVGTAYGSRYESSGYNLTVDRAATGLTPGVYNIVVFAHSTAAGSFNNLAIVRVTLQ